jgi:hypothetical protein
VDENIVKIHKAVTNKNYNEENLDADLSSSFHQLMLDEEEEINENENSPTTSSNTPTTSEAVATQVRNIEKIRDKAIESTKQQANVMLSRQKKVINSYKVGDFVLFRCSDVDRGAADPENLLCIIIEHIENSIQFRLGCKAGILDQTYPFNSLTKTELVSDFKLEDIPDKTVIVRQAISLLSLTGGQGVKKCNCRTSDCNSGRCSCKVANRQCNSKCHGGNANNNCGRPGTGTTGLEADEEQTQSSSQATQPLIKIGVSTRGRGSGRVRGSRK